MKTLQQQYNTILSQANGSDLMISIFDFSHDTCGNPTAHYIVKAKHVGEEWTGKRTQIGYNNDCLEGANNLLMKLKVSLSDYAKVLQIGSRSEGTINLFFNKSV